MNTVHTIEDVRSIVRSARAEGATIGFVPTMGYLHRGAYQPLSRRRVNCPTFR
jgi:pantoate--beta-alanine ligase